MNKPATTPGRIAKSIDVLGHTTQNHYDAAVRLIQIIEPDGQVIAYQ